jgi:beta-lactamase class A
VFFRLVTSVATLAVALPAMAQAPPVPRFGATAEVVNVTVNALDARGRPLSGLRRQDFEVYADGKRQDLEFFAAPSDGTSLKVALAVDTSGSMARARRAATTAAIRFLDEVPRARLRFLVSFDTDVRFWNLGAAADRLLSQISAAAQVGGATALRSAVAAASIAQDLTSQYVLGFVPGPSPAGRFHALKVRIRREGARVRHRAGYRVAAGPADIERKLASLAREAGGRVGVAAVLVETGERVQLNGDEGFPMQSVFKLPVALQVLQRVDEGQLDLAEPLKLGPDDMRRGHSPVRERWPGGVTFTVEEALRWTLVEGDNSTADALLARAGGPAAVTARLRALGVSGVRVDRGEDALARDLLDGGPGALDRYLADPRDTATPNGMADLLALVARAQELKPPTHARLVRWLEETRTGLTRIRGQLPEGTVVADRTGAGPTLGGINACTNDVGIVTLPDGRHVALAVFTKASPRDQATRERTIARIARALYDHWTAPPK